MRKLLSLILAVLLLGQCVQAAVTATTVWEIRQDAGDLQNGSCFDPSVAVPGTDYSQQATSQYNGTDLVIDGADNTKVTSAGHNFVAADEGNCIRVSSGTGFTVGWYVITDTASNAATLSSAVGTVGSTGGVYRVGGAALLNSTNADDYFEAMVAGNTAWVLYNASAHATGEAIAVTADGTAALPINVNGYNATRGDNPTGANCPTIAGGTNTLTFAGDYFNFRNLIITTAVSAGLSTGRGSIVENNEITNSSASANFNALTLGVFGRAINNELISTNGEALSFTNGVGSVNGAFGNYIHDSVNCIEFSTADSQIAAFNVLDNCSTAGIVLGSGVDASKILFNTIHCAETPAGSSVGISASATVGESNLIFGNIIDGCVTGASWNAAAPSNFWDYNDFFNNTTDRTNVPTGTNDKALDPTYTDAAGGNFAIGTNLKALGFPGAFSGSSTTGYLDIGAVQRQESAAGGQKAYSFVQ